MTNHSPVLDSLRRTPKTLLENPVLFVPVIIVMALQVPQLILRSTNPILSSIVSFGVSLVLLLTMPFLHGGLIGMADDALDGRTTMQTFVTEGKSNYVSMLAGYLVLTAINIVLGIVVFAVTIFGGVAFVQDGGLQTANTALLAGISLLVVLGLVMYLVLAFFAQFYGQAIVLENMGVVDGFKRSISVVRHHLLSTLGYSLTGAIIGGLTGSILSITSILLSPQPMQMLSLPNPPLPIVVGAGLVIVLGGVLFGGFFSVYSVSFYRTITNRAKAATG